MIQSMTGFSTVTQELSGSGEERPIVSIELKTVNARFFEPSLRLSSAFSYLEHDITSLLKEKLIRGRLYATIKLDNKSESLQKVKPSLSLVKGYLDACDQIKTECKVVGDVSLQDIIQLDDVFVFEKGALTKEQEAVFLSAISSALDKLVAMRHEEGLRLQEDIEQRFVYCAQSMAKIEKVSHEEIAQKKEVISQTRELDADDEQARIRLEELYRQLDKMDIHEEIVRFQSHLKAITKVLGNDQSAKGRRLDFILQELMRETNTITAKCSSFAITTVAVDIKVELEKVREQVQNIV